MRPRSCRLVISIRESDEPESGSLPTIRAAMRHSDRKLRANPDAPHDEWIIRSSRDALSPRPHGSSMTSSIRATVTYGSKPNTVAVTVAGAVANFVRFRGDRLTISCHVSRALHRPDTLGDNGLRAYIPAPSQNPAWWCNGSTSDSGSLSPGSNPGRAIEQARSHTMTASFFVEWIRDCQQPIFGIRATAVQG